MSRKRGITGSQALDSALSDLLRAVGACARLLVRGGSPESSVPRLLRALGTSVQADRALLMPVAGSGPSARDYSFTVSHEWTSARMDVVPLRSELGAEPTPFVGEDYDFTRRLELLKAGRPVVYSSVRALPANETALAQRLGTRSSVRVPVIVGGELMAMLGLDHTHGVWPWRPDELAVLWLLAEIFARAMSAFAAIETRAGPPGFVGMSRPIEAWVTNGARLFDTLAPKQAVELLLASQPQLPG